MPSFTFNGFTVGSAVAIAAVQGAVSESRSVSTWGQSSVSSASANIEVVTQGVIDAPAPVWLKAVGLSGFNVAGDAAPGEVYDPSFHEVTFVWTVRGNPLPNFDRVLNTVTAWRNANVAYGKEVCFRFPAAGTYDIDLWCVDSEGTTAVATTQVTVAAQNYAAADTIVYSESGFSGAPAGTQVTNMTELNFALATRVNPTRVTFRPGETIQDTAINPSAGFLARIDTWTEGSRVTLKPRRDPSGGASMLQFTNSNFRITQFTCRDVIFAGDWDPTTETGDYGNTCFNFGQGPNIDCFYHFHNCDFTGLEAVAVDMEWGFANRMAFSDCICTDWRQYGFYSFGALLSEYDFLGCSVYQNPLALGGGPKTGMQNDHGAFRLERQRHVYMACVDMFNNAGWSGSPPPANAVCRINSKGHDNWAAILDRVVLEGGYTKLKVDGENTATQERPGNFLADKVLMIGTARTLGYAGFHFGACTLRNAVFFQPPVPLFDGPGTFMGINPENPHPDNDLPMSIYNCTFYTGESDSRAIFFGPTSYWSEFFFENNVEYKPNASPSVAAPGSVDLATAIPGITPRFSQVRFNFGIHSLTLGGDVPDNGTFTIPYADLDRTTGFFHGTFNTGSSAATTQSYWQAAEAAGDTQHMMRVHVNGQRLVLFAERGSFEVSYSHGSHVTITNRTGGTLSGVCEIRLDRKSHLDADLPPDTSYATTSVIPRCDPLFTVGPADTLGKKAAHDFFGTLRSQPVAAGAVEA